MRRQEALAAQAALWRSFGPAQRLFTDAIALCLSFLSLADFNSASQSCKNWRQAAMRVKSLGQRSVEIASRRLPALISSPFRLVVSTLKFVSFSCDCRSCMVDRAFECPLSLFDGFSALSNLTAIDITLQSDVMPFSEGQSAIQYPPQLATAKIEFASCDPSDEPTAHVAIALCGFASRPSLTRLELKLMDVPFVLTSIGTVKQLRQLAIDGFVESHYTPATLHAIKTLPLLETLSLKHTADEWFNDNEDVFEPDWLIPLLTPPHQLAQLQSLDHGDFCLWDNDFVLQQLPSLASLTRLRSLYTSMVALPALAAFPLLQNLQLSFSSSLDFELHEENEDELELVYDHGRARLSILVPHLAHCSLTELARYHRLR